MGSIADLRLSAAKIAGGILREELVDDGDGDGGGGRENLEVLVRALEEERRKIESFKRELPLCVLLVGDVVAGMKNELEHRRRGYRGSGGGGGGEKEDVNDKRTWMSSAQLWIESYDDYKFDNENKKIAERDEGTQERRCPSSPLENDKVGFFRINGEDPDALPGLSLQILPGISFKARNRAPNPSPSRKARRCWSPELHRRFVVVLQHLGGSQVATPKQIREMMKVEGLTNDEVKSHLQKYRLHARRATPVNSSSTGWFHRPSQHNSAGAAATSGSPSPAIFLTLGDSNSRVEEDDKSDSF